MESRPSQIFGREGLQLIGPSRKIDCKIKNLIHNRYHERRPEKLKMHQKQSWSGLCPRSHWGSLQRSPDPLPGFQGVLPGGQGNEVRGKEEKGKN